MTHSSAARDRLLALVAEDDHDIRELVVAKLSSAGFEVLAFADGSSALAALKQHLPDVALLDVMMPNLSGLDIIEELGSDARTAQIPVILMSARSQEFDVQAGYALGAADYIVKPFSPRDLLIRVRKVLGEAQGYPAGLDREPE